jgi:hypothetical protein
MNKFKIYDFKAEIVPSHFINNQGKYIPIFRLESISNVNKEKKSKISRNFVSG